MLALLRTGLSHDAGPFCLRYPRAAVPDATPDAAEIEPVPFGTWEVLRRGADVAIFAVGTMVGPSLAAADALAAEGLNVTVVNCRFLKPVRRRHAGGRARRSQARADRGRGDGGERIRRVHGGDHRAARYRGAGRHPRRARPDHLRGAARSAARGLRARRRTGSPIACARCTRARRWPGDSPRRDRASRICGCRPRGSAALARRRSRPGWESSCSWSRICSRRALPARSLAEPGRARRPAHARGRRHAAARRPAAAGQPGADSRGQPRAPRLPHRHARRPVRVRARPLRARRLHGRDADRAARHRARHRRRASARTGSRSTTSCCTRAGSRASSPLRVSANDETMASYAADGVVICTPTGSTAYSLSAGGPILYPTLETLLVTPVSAHALAIRPVVLPADSVVTVQSEDGPEELLVTVDGQPGTTFAAGETLRVRRAAHGIGVVRFPGSSFFATLRQKLGWGGLPSGIIRRHADRTAHPQFRHHRIAHAAARAGVQRAVRRDGGRQVDHRRRARRCCSASGRAPT